MKTPKHINDIFTMKNEKRGDAMSNKKWPTPEEVCAYLDKWTKNYLVKVQNLVIVDDAPTMIKEPRWHVSEVFPSRGKIFQQREEFLEFLKVVCAAGLHDVAIEVGLDQGGTHMGWRQLFEQVASIEIDINKCVKFLATNKVDSRSMIICADSCDEKTAKILKKTYKSVDLVFIDGDHQYSSVLCDYKCLSGLVKKGGIIGFHDTIGRHPSHLGVVKFIKKLISGEIDGRKHNIQLISKNGTGISYEIVE